MTTHTVWVQLYFGNETFETPAKIIDVHDVYDLKKAVKAEFPNALQHMDAAQLKVFPAGTTSPTLIALKGSAQVPTNTTEDSPLAVFATMTAQLTPQERVLSLSDVHKISQTISASGGSIPSATDHPQACMIKTYDLEFVDCPERFVLQNASRFASATQVGNWERIVSESAVSQLVKCVIDDVLCYLGIDDKFWLAPEAQVFSIRPDYWVIAFNCTPVGVIEVKKPWPEDILERPTVLGELFDYMIGLSNYFGVKHPFGILTTLKQWRFCWLPQSETFAREVVSIASSQSDRNITPQIPQRPQVHSNEAATSSPPGLTPSKIISKRHRTTLVDDGDDEKVVAEENRDMHGTQVLDTSDLRTLPMIAACISKMTNVQSFEPYAVLEKKICERSLMCFKQKGMMWARLKLDFPKWDQYPSERTTQFFLLEELGKGADGRAWLACSGNGSVCVIKFAVRAKQEHSIWKVIYPEFKVRIQLLNGHDALIMPHFFAVSKHARKETLGLVKTTLLTRFVHNQLKHNDVAWRNLGLCVNDQTGKEEVVVYDLANIEHCRDTTWVDAAIEKLRKTL
eukprot:c13163_g1_i6.p1 GENE.c13163_g1_i6~~c13163_g1_i6.p1  ORF type:complete len:568 (-),score=120.21 c13163_g1_i6:171-1874(-)